VAEPVIESDGSSGSESETIHHSLLVKPFICLLSQVLCVKSANV
jgi:hypothetical protein